MLLLKLSVLLIFFAVQADACLSLSKMIFTFVSHKIWNIGLKVDPQSDPPVGLVVSMLSYVLPELFQWMIVSNTFFFSLFLLLQYRKWHGHGNGNGKNWCFLLFFSYYFFFLPLLGNLSLLFFYSLSLLSLCPIFLMFLINHLL